MANNKEDEFDLFAEIEGMEFTKEEIESLVLNEPNTPSERVTDKRYDELEEWLDEGLDTGLRMVSYENPYKQQGIE